jgi:allophanate hydrolase
MPDSTNLPSLEIPVLGQLYETGALSPASVVHFVLDQIRAYPDPSVWIHLLPLDELLDQGRQAEKRRTAGEFQPLYGVPFAVKDNIDVAGVPTTAACPAFAYVPERSAPVVQRLIGAGAILIGKTNLDQFGAGLAGDRSPYGVCRCVFDSNYISGGSSSGSAVAVAAGMVSFALGTDTAGSGRVPAGCNNIVGLKPTPGLLSTEGVVPACPSLDCVSIFALTLSDASAVMKVAAGSAAPDLQATSSLASNGSSHLDLVFAVPREEDLEFFGDQGQSTTFREALERLCEMGARRIAVDFRPFREVGKLLYEGPWLAERLASVEAFLSEHADSVHPVTKAILAKGAAFSAVDVFKARRRLGHLAKACLAVFEEAEVLVVPTLPAFPRVVEVQEDSAGWSKRLGIYTNFVNLLGLAAVAVPAGFTVRGLPAGITLVGPGDSDRRLAELGSTWQQCCRLPLGASGRLMANPRNLALKSHGQPVPPDYVRVAVAGAHLRGQPLNPELRRLGARFVRTALTAPRYRFVAFLYLDPPRPALLRDDDRAGAIRVEVYDVPTQGFGKLVASVGPPLAIGTVELEGGERIKGFVCESSAAVHASDITDSGGWAAFRRQTTTSASRADLLLL